MAEVIKLLTSEYLPLQRTFQDLHQNSRAFQAWKKTLKFKDFPGFPGPVQILYTLYKSAFLLARLNHRECFKETMVCVTPTKTVNEVFLAMSPNILNDEGWF